MTGRSQRDRTKYRRILLSAVLLCLWLPSALRAEDGPSYPPILVISSYNPDSYNTTSNIVAFIDEYKRLGGLSEVQIENMNCLSFSEAQEWKPRMRSILTKYREDKPALIILLGQEAWSAYLSQEADIRGDIPVFCGMASSNAVLLPDTSVSTMDWDPESIDVFRDMHGLNIKAGYAYHYDIPKNIELILDFYPDTKNIAFISDNTYGGVSLQALVREEMEAYPELNLILLDGRQHSLYTIVDKIHTLPKHSVILLGTWKVDKNDSFFMKNAVYAMTGANNSVPAFTVTSTGLGYWALGGYTPEYRTIGVDMARQAYNLLNGNDQSVHLSIIPNQFRFDKKLLDELGFKGKPLPRGSELMNVKPTFWQQYRYEFWAILAVFTTLVIGLVISLMFYFHTKRLKVNLEKSEGLLRVEKENAEKTAHELRIAKDAAEQSDRLKSAFLANMSHEIRTPLNAITGFSEILASTDDEQEKKEYVGIIQSNNAILLQLIGDILDLSKIEANILEFTFAEVDLDGLLSEIEKSSQLKVAGRDVAIVFEQGLPGHMITTDRNRLMQVVVNLINNAIKFTAQGSIRFGYRRAEGNTLYFYVKDTGTGIPAGQVDRVFGRFVKLNSFVQGTGLGLSISQTIIHKLGGEIGVESEEGVGSMFWFTLPDTAVEGESGPESPADAGSPSPDRAAGADGTGELSRTEVREKPVILIAEDTPSNYLLFETVLKDDFRLLHAADGREAVELFEKERPDLILMDIKMPVMDGYEATTCIRSISADVPIVAVTAFAYADDEKRILRSGFNGYLAKPIYRDTLREAIRKYLGRP